MAKLHRIIWIDAQIRADKFPNARTIAQEFEISQRQAARDLEYLRDSLGSTHRLLCEKARLLLCRDLLYPAQCVHDQ